MSSKRDRRRERLSQAGRSGGGAPEGRREVQIPRNGIARLNLGQSFAEYDDSLSDPQVFVHTPAFSAAQDFRGAKFFFVGRRGTGKTTIRRYCDTIGEHTRVIVPEIFSPASSILDLDLFGESSKRPFRSLVSAFRRSLQDEILNMWRQDHRSYVGLPAGIQSELESFEGLDFDSRTLQFISRVSRALASGDEQQWLTENKAAKKIAEEMKGLSGSSRYTLLIDSIDDFWEGTSTGLVYLTAFMHACLEMSTQIPWTRSLLFLRENIFERVRQVDSESSRLETSVVGLEWTDEQLLDLIERRLNRRFTTKIALGGATWNAWFENPEQARAEIFGFCQKRPRDVLIYVSNAIESAQSHHHTKIMIEDIQQARRRFSDNRLKDLGDEYAENYPQIALVLSRFYGLGRRFTLTGVEAMLDRLLRDEEVKKLCASWIFNAGQPERFVRILYDIGFVGIGPAGGQARFRALGPQDTSPPPISDSNDIEIHPCYWDALDLQDQLIRSLPEEREFGRIGLLVDLPDGLDATHYSEEITSVIKRLEACPRGTAGASEFEEIVGQAIKLCFFRALSNVEARVRDVDGRVVRDWIAANRAQSGFWELVRQRYGATQIIWECKNYDDIGAADFQQVDYYLNEAVGHFGIIVFRGEVSPAHYSHIRRISEKSKGFILPLTDRDLKTFLRQARNGKVKEDHIQDRYDAVARKIS